MTYIIFVFGGNKPRKPTESAISQSGFALNKMTLLCIIA